jgi:hypothetical protein
VALQLSAIFDFNQQSQQLKADFMLITNWTDSRCLHDGVKNNGISHQQICNVTAALDGEC